ncbi:MAG: hypothetical protein CVU38_16760 [Chloroflexi bacterium HGW-Chloroflexi-1]|nr:MAG: hypothetical protein CVU38_16760 [Chloroflexi bacterium HGW-Chloroflexi-1]
MAESKSKRMPKFGSLDELVAFFDTHDMGEYWDSLPEVEFEVDIQRRTHIFSLDEDLVERLTAVSKARHVPSERLINVWLWEKLGEQLPAVA